MRTTTIEMLQYICDREMARRRAELKAELMQFWLEDHPGALIIGMLSIALTLVSLINYVL